MSTHTYIGPDGESVHIDIDDGVPADDDRDMSEPTGRTTRAAARKRQAERDKRDPNWRSRHFRDDLTVTDEVPCVDCEEEGPIGEAVPTTPDNYVGSVVSLDVDYSEEGEE